MVNQSPVRKSSVQSSTQAKCTVDLFIINVFSNEKAYFKYKDEITYSYAPQVAIQNNISVTHD